MTNRSFFDAIEARDPKLALEILDDVVKAATKKASEGAKAAGLCVDDGPLKRWSDPDDPDPDAELRSRKDDPLTKTKPSESSGA